MKCKVMAELFGTVLLSALFVANVTAAEAPAEIGRNEELYYYCEGA